MSPRGHKTGDPLGTVVDRMAAAGWYLRLLRRVSDADPPAWHAQLLHPCHTAVANGTGRTATSALESALAVSRTL